MLLPAKLGMLGLLKKRVFFFGFACWSCGFSPHEVHMENVAYIRNPVDRK